MNLHQTNSLTHLLVQVMKLHRHSIHLLIRDFDVHPGQPPLLRHLSERDGQSQKELAGSMQIAPATMTVMLKRMEKAGLVYRRPDERDQRVIRVYLTKQGCEAHEAVREALRELEAKCFEHFTEEEKSSLRHMMLRAHENLTAVPGTMQPIRKRGADA
ncbi:MarR family winged helix-turn-helix transcriptional regulator [Paenibacillus sp. MBLB4367]|uniref:MarR family winged helix-turn-helix transcriptional regulator n=1 Tax=Paenibacillus sp. MBLB4367 TaxID=3384767 RepID=UPI00390814C4